MINQNKRKFYMGVDVGGTFTDGVVIEEGGKLNIFKVPTISHNPSEGFMNLIARAAKAFSLSERGFLQNISKLTYGTTIATNTLIQGKGAKTGLITTRGFRDTLTIARIGREYLTIDLQVEHPPPLTPRSLIEEVSERVDYTGKVVTPLDLEDVSVSLQKLADKQVDAMAVCLLWSFKNPQHEQKVRDMILERFPQMYVSISSEIVPLIGEYERTATTVVNASLGPPLKNHLARLLNQLQEGGLDVPLLIMQSTGGVTPAEHASRKPVTLVNSGPAGGVIASKYYSELLEMPNFICIDMGGTTFDVSLIDGGQYSTNLVSRICEHNIFVPTTDIHSIGAGGGSIAWSDIKGRLKVGPQSAGAEPGPVCYGKGGKEPTVTDADVVLGRINPSYFLGGELPLDKAAALKAIEEKIAAPLGMSTIQAAWGINQIVDANMADAVRLVTLRKGRDPREYAMVAFGGAGPTHASSMARELGIKTIVVPALATAQSAFGIVASDIVNSLAITDLEGLDNPSRINQHFYDLEQEGVSLLRSERVSESDIRMVRHVDMRYRGQAHEVSVPVPAKPLDSKDLAQLIESFERQYESLYGPGTAFRQVGFEIVTFRVDAIGRTEKPLLIRHSLESGDASRAVEGKREVFYGEGGFVNTPVYRGERLRAGNSLKGPAIIEYPGTTAVVYPGQSARVDAHLNVILEDV